MIIAMIEVAITSVHSTTYSIRSSILYIQSTEGTWACQVGNVSSNRRSGALRTHETWTDNAKSSKPRPQTWYPCVSGMVANGIGVSCRGHQGLRYYCPNLRDLYLSVHFNRSRCSSGQRFLKLLAYDPDCQPWEVSWAKYKFLTL